MITANVVHKGADCKPFTDSMAYGDAFELIIHGSDSRLSKVMGFTGCFSSSVKLVFSNIGDIFD